MKHHDEKAAEEIETHLAKIKWYLWNGNIRKAISHIDWLVDDLDIVECDYPSLKAFRKVSGEFQTYIANNAGTIPNYTERHRYGERVSTGFVESTVNTVVGKRQQMRWSKSGAHLLLQARSRALDGTLRTKFESWFPGLAVNSNSPTADQVAA